MNRWIAHTAWLGAPLLIAGLTWAGEVTAAQSPTGSMSVKQAAKVDANLGRRVLQPNDQGDDVENLQRALERSGYYTGAFDGVYGSETETAVAIYQSENRLPVTGIADSTTLQNIGFNLPAPVARNVPPNPTPIQVSPARVSSTSVSATNFSSTDINPARVSSTNISQNFEPNVRDLTRRRLSSGDSGSDVSALQSALNSYGIPVGIDGVYGGETAEAVRTYQRIQGLPVNGVADTETLEDMGFDFVEAPVAAQTDNASFTPRAGELTRGQLSPGDTGADVRSLQRALRDFGLPVAVDGVYGTGTANAVRTYQRTRGLTVSGIADRDTLEDIGFESPDLRYIAAVIGDESQLAEVRRFFPNAYIDSNIEGEFINIGNFNSREPAEARTFAARGRDLDARVIYRRSGLF